jgi:hypothetical protein
MTAPIPAPKPISWAEEAALAIASASAMAVVSVVTRWLANIQAGKPDLPAAEVAAALAQQLHIANEIAYTIGDRAMADIATEHAGFPITELGLTPPDDEEARLALAVDTIFSADQEALVQRMERLAGAEPLTATRRSLQEAMKRRGVESWRRVVMPEACESCASRVGEIRSIDVMFGDHPSCRCTLAPVISTGWGDEVKQRQLQLRLVAPSGARFSSGLAFDSIEKGPSA